MSEIIEEELLAPNSKSRCNLGAIGAQTAGEYRTRTEGRHTIYFMLLCTR